MVSRKILIVFDFDWSLVEENSDTWVLQKLGALNIFKRLQSQGEPLWQPDSLHESA